jgi:carbon-monoxide dehydrogenase medium subunit
VEACSLIGGPQVRNVATLGGNVAHGLPAADGTIALLALGAQAEIAGIEGRQWHDLEDLFTGPGETTFDRGRQILVRFRLPISGKDEGSAFARVMRPQGVAIAILNMAAWVKLNEDKTIKDVRLAVGPSGPRPRRARKAESNLIGQTPAADRQGELHRLILEDSQLRTSRHRATKPYREQLVGVLLERTLPVAYQRALESLNGQ